VSVPTQKCLNSACIIRLRIVAAVFPIDRWLFALCIVYYYCVHILPLGCNGLAASEGARLNDTANQAKPHCLRRPQRTCLIRSGNYFISTAISC